ncbi:MAG: hypothetical protein IIZ83_03200 [Oscillospiraceae bacterium]|nr:hypothetical protein [Oscillospiraceae bacterium]
MDNEQKQMRRRVLVLITIATIVFFALGLVFAVLHERIPQRRIEKIESLLDAGNSAAARRLAGRVDDEALRESYFARCDYLDAEAAFAEGDWAAARGFYAAAGSYEDSEDKARLCDYRRAEELLSAGSPEEAEALFTSLGGFEDAADRALGCRYERASALESAGELSEAGALFASLGGYLDAETRLVRIATAVTGISDEDEALSVFRGMTPEARAKREALGALRDALPQGIIAVGFYHTVGLQSDGTVVACGDNSYGQCDVGALHDVKAVAAGAYHTVTLHSDGTVSAIGRDSEEQCATAEWRNVTAIAASDYATFGLTEDGTLLCTGFNDYTEPESWSGLKTVAGGSYNLAALRADGSVWSYPALKGLDALRGAEAVDVNTGYAVAVLGDGSVVSTNFDLSAWHDILAVSASSTAILALDAQGRVSAHFFRESDRLDFSSVTDAVAIAAGGTHFAVVLSDGSVRVFGETENGAGMTADWSLAVG